jgi:hypothetical protein
MDDPRDTPDPEDYTDMRHGAADQYDDWSDSDFGPYDDEIDLPPDAHYYNYLGYRVEL